MKYNWLSNTIGDIQFSASSLTPSTNAIGWYIYGTQINNTVPRNIGELDLNYDMLQTTASVLKISSSSNNDVFGTGSGAWAVFINGLDLNYDPVVEVVFLNGQTPVTTITEFLRVRRSFTALSGSYGTVNDGDIYFHNSDTVTNGVPDDMTKTYLKMNENIGITRQMIFTVPRDRSVFATSLAITSGDGKESLVTLSAVAPGSFSVLDIGSFKTFQNPFQWTPKIPQLLVEKSDLLLFGSVTAGTDIVTSFLELIEVSDEVLNYV